MREESAERLMLPRRAPARPARAARASGARDAWLLPAVPGCGCGTPYPATSNKLPIRET